MPAKTITKYGDINIDENVIATIAGMAAMESYGIVGMASQNAADGFLKLLRWDNLTKGIKVETEKTGITIDLHVILEYGVKISVVAKNIMDNVKFSVEDLTGVKIENINVHVDGIRVGR